MYPSCCLHLFTSNFVSYKQLRFSCSSLIASVCESGTGKLPSQKSGKLSPFMAFCVSAAHDSSLFSGLATMLTMPWESGMVHYP